MDIYSNWILKERILTTNIWSRELSKFVVDVFLAQRVFLIIAIFALCENTGANVDEVAKAIGTDNRNGLNFGQNSVGFGEVCFQKDILNLLYLCRYFTLAKVAVYWLQVVKLNDY